MHEYSIIQSLLGQVERHARDHGAAAVHKLYVSIGELSGVEVPLLETAYETFRERTLCARAPMEVHAVAAEWSCPSCSRPVPRAAALRCPDCGRPARLTRGDEIVLERIEMEVS